MENMEGYPGELGRRFGECPKEVADFADRAAEGLKPGDTVYKIRILEPQRICPLCEGEGRVDVKLTDETFSVKCPKCGGSGHEKRFLYIDKATVENISFSICPQETGGWAWKIGNLKLAEDDYANLIAPIFLTEKEAIAFLSKSHKCDKDKKWRGKYDNF